MLEGGRVRPRRRRPERQHHHRRERGQDERALSGRGHLHGTRAFYKRSRAARPHDAQFAAQVCAGGSRGGGGGRRSVRSFGGATPSAKAAPSPATAPIASEAPAGRRSSLLASPSATAGSASRYLYPSMSEGLMPEFLTVSKILLSASASPSARSARACFSPSARRTFDFWSASAFRIAAWRRPSARRIAACFSPSACSTAARLARSARICCSIASWIVRGGSMLLSSTRVTRTPHFSVASATTERSWKLIESRLVSVCSSVIAPTTFRSVVIVSCSIAWSTLATSYLAFTASVTW